MDSPEFTPTVVYEPPDSLWKLVEDNVSLEEKSEIREILGDSLVDQSLELHAEVVVLLEIWRSYTCDTDSMNANSTKLLPEPPGMRDNLRQHIRMLVENIQEKLGHTGRDYDTVLSQHRSSILEYALDDSSRGSSSSGGRTRPSSSFSSSRSGRNTPMMRTPSSEGDRLSGSTSASEKVESVHDSLNILKIDEVVQELRSTLQDEVEQLLSDVRFLHNCLEDESDYRCESRMTVVSEPSIQDLREERAKLEKTSLSVPDSLNIINSMPEVKRCLPCLPKHLIKPLSPISHGRRIVRPSLSAGTSQVSRSAPLRATHSGGKSRTLDSTGNEGIERVERTFGARSSGENDHKRTTGHSRMSGPSSPSGCPGVSGPPMRPSPPSSAKRGTGRPAPNRFRQRFKDATRQSSM